MEAKRFDVKLDTFLRRNLSREDYERISTSVLCAFSSSEEKRKYRHAVLGHKCIYITDVPPKSHRIAVHLRDIVAVEIVSIDSLCSYMYAPPLIYTWLATEYEF